MTSFEETYSNKIYFSFGFRCSSASILKRLNLKHESYPFDWLISNIKTVKHCLEDDFKQFLNQDNYERKYTNTYVMAESKEGFICDEHLMANMAYQPIEMQNEENTYKWSLAMNHHNIKDQKDYDYYVRCVGRLKSLFETNTPKTFIHIAPTVTMETYNEIKMDLFKQMVDFDMFIQTKTQNINGLFFILVKGSYNNERKCLYKTEEGSEIWELSVPEGFIDAGENFMGDCSGIISFIENTILKKINIK